MNYNYRELIKKVGENCVRDKDATHVLMNDNKKMSINNQNMTTFWEEYCNLVFHEEEQETALDLAEVVLNEIPLMQDFLFRFQVDDGDLKEWCPYDDTMIASICLIYQNVLNDFFNIIDENQFIVTVLESTDYWFESEDVVRMRLRIQFPNTKISITNQHGFIRNEVLAQLRKKKITSKFMITPLDSWEKMMSKDLSFSLYGSTKKGEPKIKFIHMWGRLNNRNIENDDFYELEVKNVFDIDKHSQVYRGIVDTRIFKKELEYEYWMPMFLSLHYCSNVQLIKENMEKKAINVNLDAPRTFGEKKDHTTNKNGYENENEHENENEIMLSEKFLEIIAPKRFMQESYWLDIGRALYKHKQGMALWIKYTTSAARGITILPDYIYKILGIKTEKDRDEEDEREKEQKKEDVKVKVGKKKNKEDLSKKSSIPFKIDDKRSNEELIKLACELNFDTFVSSKINVRTLAEYAMEDNWDLYNNWHKKWCLDAMEDAVNANGSDVLLAEALYRFNWLRYVYDPSNNKWYVHYCHGWDETSKGFMLRKDISNRFKKRFEAVCADLTNTRADGESGSSKLNKTIKQINAVIVSLDQNAKKNKIMYEAQEKFEVDRFSTFLDDNYTLLGVKNGVLEIIGKDIIFRKTKPQDYISMSAGVPFHTYFSFSHPLVIECMKWMREMFEEDLMRHFLKFGASILKRRNVDKILPIFTGNGNNSKSMVIKLFMIVFGMYAIKVPVAIFSEKFVSSGGASPQTARFLHKAIGFGDEADDSMPMNKNAVKKYTGGDSFFTRRLNENGGDVELSLKIAIITNDIPNIEDPDDATKRRVKIIPFLSEWILNYNATYEEQMERRKFRMDLDFEKRIPLLAPAFLWILTQYYPTYCKEGLNDPPSVVEHTKNYWEENDIYGKFETDCIAKAYLPDGEERDMEQKVTMNELYAEFKTWFRSSYPTSKLPNRDIVKAAYQKKWGRVGINGWSALVIVGLNTDAFEILPFSN